MAQVFLSLTSFQWLYHSITGEKKLRSMEGLSTILLLVYISFVLIKSLVVVFTVIAGRVYEQICAGVSCLVVSPAERERGGSSKVAEAVWVSSLLSNINAV